MATEARARALAAAKFTGGGDEKSVRVRQAQIPVSRVSRKIGRKKNRTPGTSGFEIVSVPSVYFGPRNTARARLNGASVNRVIEENAVVAGGAGGSGGRAALALTASSRAAKASSRTLT